MNEAPFRRRRSGWFAAGLVFVVLLAGLAAAWVFVIRPPGREVAYEGVSLSEWIRRYQRSDAAPDAPEMRPILAAVRRIGTNRLPELVRSMAYDPAPRRIRTARLGRAIPRFIRSPRILGYLLDDEEEYRANSATAALVILGPGALPELPELARLADGGECQVAARRAMWVLVHVGDQGMAPLMNVVTNLHHPNRVFAVDFIGDFGTNAKPAIPWLVEALEDPSQAVRVRAKASLKKIQPEKWGRPEGEG